MTTDCIEFNPAILQGKPVIRGTRILVTDRDGGGSVLVS